jgi:hypothetical protein
LAWLENYTGCREEIKRIFRFQLCLRGNTTATKHGFLRMTDVFRGTALISEERCALVAAFCLSAP